MAAAINQMQFAGSTDWRLPTGVESSISFHESEPSACQTQGPGGSKFIPPFLFSMDSEGTRHPRFFLAPYRTFGMHHDSFDSKGFGDEALRGDGGYSTKKHLICEGNYCSKRQGYDYNGAGWIFVRFASKSVPTPQKGADEFVDPATSLTWKRCPVGTKVALENESEKCIGASAQLFSMDEALGVINKNYPDWRLPTSTEILYLISRVSDLKAAPYWLGGSHLAKTCDVAAAGNARLFPEGAHTNDSFVYIANQNSAGSGAFWTTNLLLNNRLCKISTRGYGTEKVPLFLVKGYDSSGEWEKLLGLKLNSFKLKASASQAIQRDNLAFESSWLGQLVKTYNEPAKSSSNTKVDWAFTSEEKGGGLAHWYTKKYSGKCLTGRKAGELITIHLLKSSGKYQEVNGAVKNSLSEAAREACS